MADEMPEALHRMASHRAESMMVDRAGWTDEQWCDDAERLMGDLDGSVTSLVNGHVSALLRERKRLADDAHHEFKCHQAVPAVHVVVGDADLSDLNDHEVPPSAVVSISRAVGNPRARALMRICCDVLNGDIYAALGEIEALADRREGADRG